LDLKKRYTEEQIIGFLKEADGGVALTDLCRRHTDLFFSLIRNIDRLRTHIASRFVEVQEKAA